MKTILILRDEVDENQALASFYVFDESKKLLFKSESIERGWMDNQNRISCIPEGLYDLVLEYSPRFNTELWELKGVKDRSECKIHSANYASQLNGCIAPGEKRADLNKDGYNDVTNSKHTLSKFHEVMGSDTKAKIRITSIII